MKFQFFRQSHSRLGWCRSKLVGLSGYPYFLKNIFMTIYFAPQMITFTLLSFLSWAKEKVCDNDDWGTMIHISLIDTVTQFRHPRATTR